MIHEGECKIVVPASVGQHINLMVGGEPPTPTDAELEEVFPDYIKRGKIFVGKCCQEEDKGPMDQVTPQDYFRWGMKFVITEAKKLGGE